MNIREIARRANVSRATVSRVINQVQSVDSQLAEKVRQVILEIGYIPNHQAQALARGRSRTIGLIVAEVSGGNPFFTEFMLHFERASVEAGYEVLIGFADIQDHPDDVTRCVNRMLERRVDGIAVLTFGMESQMLKKLPRTHVPLVFPDAPANRPCVSNIKIDYLSGMRECVTYLQSLGHARIAYLSGNLKLSGMLNRLKAFRQAIDKSGLSWDESLIVPCAHTFEGGAEGMKTLLGWNNPPTSVMCCNDVAAIGALKTARTQKLKVPRDISIVGLDDLPLALYAEPELTTIRFSPRELAQLTVEALLQRISPSPQIDQKDMRFEYKTRLVIRKSTGVARKRKRVDHKANPRQTIHTDGR